MPFLAVLLAFLLTADANALAAQAKATTTPERPPALSAFATYTRRMSAAYGTTAPLEPCRLKPLSFAQADSAKLRWYHHWITLPGGFAHGPMRLRYDSLWHPQLQRKWLGQEWLDDLFIEPVDWYRWTRAPTDSASTATTTGTLVQLREYRSYPVILARRPWTVTDAEECEWQTLGEGARVMRFTLVHPELPPQWVLTAAWYGRREPTARGFLSIGPDEASQAEALEILRLLRPDDAKASAPSPPRPLTRLTGARARNPAVQLRVEPDAEFAGESVLVVEYPPPSEDPAARDVWLDAEIRDWSASSGMTLQMKPSHPTRVSVSFFDRNRVAYTTWADLPDTTWQTVPVTFDAIRPNPHFSAARCKDRRFTRRE